MNSTFVKDYDDGKTMLEHLNGVDWYHAPIPKRWHRCWVQTRGWVNFFTLVERCACGAVRTDAFGWSERNSRRKK